jgi:hypothetical protein
MISEERERERERERDTLLKIHAFETLIGRL